MPRRLLFDECVPRPLQRELPDFDIRTVPQLGWAGKQNGELIALMKREGFGVLITTDQNLPHQQNLRAAGITVVVLIAMSNHLPDLQPLVPELKRVLGRVGEGELINVELG